MGHAPEPTDESQDPGPPDVRPSPWQELIPQPRVKPQYDPVEIARKALDDMEKGDRLHGQNRKTDDKG